MTTALDEKRFPLLDLSSLREPEVPTPMTTEILTLLSQPTPPEKAPTPLRLRDRVQKISPPESTHEREVHSASTRASLWMVIIIAVAIFYQYVGMMHERNDRAVADVRERMRYAHDNCIARDRSEEIRKIDCFLEQKFIDELEGLQRNKS